jgi:hypothetical protein
MRRFANYYDLADGSLPQAGNFASLIALSKYGVLSDGEGPRNIESADRLSRCGDPSDPDYLECLTGNAVWDDIIFAAMDLDGDGVIDRFPSLRGVFDIDMAPPERTDGVVITDSISRITGLVFLDMGPALRSTDTAATDIFARITNVSRIVMGKPLDTDGDGSDDD